MQFFTCQQLHYTCSANYLPELVYKLSAGFLCPHFLQYESVKISKPSFFLMCRRDRRYTYMVLRKCPFRFQIIFLFTDDRFFFIPAYFSHSVFCCLLSSGDAIFVLHIFPLHKLLFCCCITTVNFYERRCNVRKRKDINA